MASRSAFEIAAARVANACPREFREMIDALEVVQREALDALAAAPADQVLSQQGYARAYQAFVRSFKECTIKRQAEQPKPRTDNAGFGI